MADFFKEYWLWIVLPFALVLGGLAVLYFMANDGGTNDFIYNVF